MLERERGLCQQWRMAAVNLPAPHVVDTCQCWACHLCRACEALLVEVDRLTGPENVGTGGVPGGV